MNIGPRGTWIILVGCGCLTTGFGAWDLLVQRRVTPVLWVIGPCSLLALIPTDRLPGWMRDLGYKTQIRGELGLFALGLALVLLPLLDGVVLPAQARKLTFWVEIIGICLMIVGLMTARIGVIDWAARVQASPGMREEMERINQRRRQR